MDAPKVRVSKSKSQFSQDQSHFQLVYKSETGKYFKPIKIDVGEAIRIAREYERSKLGDLQKGVTIKAAKFIYRKSLELGLLETEKSDASTHDGPLTEEVDAETVDGLRNHETEITFAPRFFPTLAYDHRVQLDSDVIETITFILCEVDPVHREASMLPLRELAGQTHTRIATEAALEHDHHYLLPAWHDFSTKEFNESWVAFKRAQTGGQAETDLRKILQNIERFQIDDAGVRLRDSQHYTFLATVQDNAIPLLYRIYRRARNKVTSELEKKESNTQSSFLNRLTKSLSKTKELPRVEAVFEEIAERYLHQTCKLGRLLRSPLLTN